ncbi:MAG TPA: hypothetical protein VM597_29800 [Gemmataceae bacterium]|nr:hypothetical protein [Gemmataceae bacterium]
MTRFLTAVVAVAVAASAVRAELADGNYRMSQHIGAVGESPILVVKVEKKDGKPTIAAVEGSTKNPLTVSDLTVDGDKVTFVFTAGTSKYTFRGTQDAKDAKVVRGTFSDGDRSFRASLTGQEGDMMVRPTPPKAPEPMTQAQKFNLAATQLNLKARQAKDPNDKAELQEKAKAAQKEADEKVPGLYREVIAKHADSPFAVDAASNLLRMAAKSKPTADEVAAWVKLIEADAARYGASEGTAAVVGAGESLINQKDIAALALPVAEKADKAVTEKDPLALQSRVLKLLLAAQKAAGKTDAAIESRLAKVEAKLDEEYKAKVPPFKPTKFAGRKDKAANRVAVMELFTGAQCPPCIAADVAFDALEMAYDPKDLVLIQYHMHIPGPDPLTNPSSVARWDFYREKFPEGIRGTPSTLFNGKPAAGGGGGMANAKSKFTQYAGLIDPLLEEKTDLKVGGSATAAGDKLKVAVDVAGVKEPGDNVRLHVILVEETIKYTGGNGLRFHHQVVRDLPGGADGTKITKEAQKADVEIDLAKVKAGLTKYLDDFAADRPFPNADRPMDLKHLKVIALVQNHDTREILNAVQMDVK